jgi:hypothetical protein
MQVNKTLIVMLVLNCTLLSVFQGWWLISCSRWHWDKVLSLCFGFPLSLSSNLCSIPLSHSSTTNALTTASLSTSQHTNTLTCILCSTQNCPRGSKQYNQSHRSHPGELLSASLPDNSKEQSGDTVTALHYSTFSYADRDILSYVLSRSSGVGKLWHACQACHAERSLMARWVNLNTVIMIL